VGPVVVSSKTGNVLEELGMKCPGIEMNVGEDIARSGARETMWDTQRLGRMSSIILCASQEIC
jgi:hypothetical protein